MKKRTMIKLAADGQELPADATEIVIPGAANLCSVCPGRRRFLTVEVSHDGGRLITEELVYLLRDLRGYPITT